MSQYWVSFIEDYKNEIFSKSISQILEAFWCYSNNREDKCKELMSNNN